MDSVLARSLARRKTYFTFTFTTAARCCRFEIQLPDSSKRASLAQKRERHTHAPSGILKRSWPATSVSKNRGRGGGGILG